MEELFDLAERDIQIENINQQINQKQLFLINKSSEIKKNIKSNTYLSIVNKEYETYIKELIAIKKKELIAFKKLLEYIHSDKNIHLDSDLIYTQDKIILKISQIEKQLNELL